MNPMHILMVVGLLLSTATRPLLAQSAQDLYVGQAPLSQVDGEMFLTLYTPRDQVGTAFLLFQQPCLRLSPPGIHDDFLQAQAYWATCTRLNFSNGEAVPIQDESSLLERLRQAGFGRYLRGTAQPPGPDGQPARVTYYLQRTHAGGN